jgi:hypothetical protein
MLWVERWGLNLWPRYSICNIVLQGRAKRLDNLRWASIKAVDMCENYRQWNTTTLTTWWRQQRYVPDRLVVLAHMAWMFCLSYYFVDALRSARFWVPTVALLRSQIFRDLTPSCWVYDSQCWEGLCCVSSGCSSQRGIENVRNCLPSDSVLCTDLNPHHWENIKYEILSSL